MAPRSDPPLTPAQRARLGGLKAAELYPDRHYARAFTEARQCSLDAWLDAVDPRREIDEAARADLSRRFRSLYASAIVTLRHSRNRAKREAAAETVEAAVA